MGPEETAKAAGAAMYAGDLASQRLGIEITEIGPGRATAVMRIAETMINGHDVAHGGYVFLLADTAFAFACNSYGDNTLAAGAEISFVAPVRLGDELVADAVERIRYGKSGLYDVTVRRSSDGAVVAEFRGRSRTVAGSLLDPQTDDGANP
jgi:acyl-CoA thioesterase